jgi:ubiquitin carboxyl-terminal hydrolase 10
MLIEQLPPILIIHLKCFLYDEIDGIKKVNKSINYTVNLTLPKTILTEQARKHSFDRYKLFAVEYHQGDQAIKGHYITDVFHPGLQGWVRFDDGNVQVVTSNQVINPIADKLTPYLLFYRRD